MRHLLLFTFLLIASSAFAQPKKRLPPPPPRPPSKREDMLWEKSQKCFYSNKYSITQRSQIYPFNKAVKVMLISFNENHRIPVNNRVMTDSLILERVIINSKQTDSLTSILYNIGYTPVSKKYRYEIVNQSGCYEPRNGIVFINAAGEAFEYIEICFQCRGTRTSSEAVQQGEFCSTKFDLIRKFFLDAGIKYGAQKTIAEEN